MTTNVVPIRFQSRRSSGILYRDHCANADSGCVGLLVSDLYITGLQLISLYRSIGLIARNQDDIRNLLQRCFNSIDSGCVSLN